MLQEKLRVAAFISGGASTLEQIIKATQDNRLPDTQIVTVVTSNPDAIPIDRKRLIQELDIPLTIVRPADYRSKDEYGEGLLAAVAPVRPKIIGQYGHTPLTPGNVIAEFEGRMINQHPGPVDPSPHDFGGKGMSSADRVHAARLLFVRTTKRNYWTEVTAQRVAVEFDKGKAIKRGRVEIKPTDTVESLRNRAIEKEWEVQIAALRDFQEGQFIDLPPYDDLVLPSEYELLNQVKLFAALLYASG